MVFKKNVDLLQKRQVARKIPFQHKINNNRENMQKLEMKKTTKKKRKREHKRLKFMTL